MSSSAQGRNSLNALLGRARVARDPRQQTLASFDWQWAHLAEGDFMPGDPWFDEHASRVLAGELCCISPDWFRGKRVLDAGCGQGRWTQALLDLGASVTAVDYSLAGLQRVRALCGETESLIAYQTDLLDPPDRLTAQKFDLVFSFGVLHHTGDTWRALENVAGLVGDGGALFLYLYGAHSWSKDQRDTIERLRAELASLSFSAKIAELRLRFPGDDPHQMFDLLSPVINDRVSFDEVAARLGSLGFDRIEQTIADTEVYVRAVRRGFPQSALLPLVGDRSEYKRELDTRFAIRSGAAFEDKLRSALAAVPVREVPAWLTPALRRRSVAGTLLDVSYRPDRITAVFPPESTDVWDAPSVITSAVEDPRTADIVCSIGCSVGACRFPQHMMSRMWGRVRPGGWLIVEVTEDGFPQARRGVRDRIMDARSAVPEKVAALLRRNAHWCTGEALYALGGTTLLSPIDLPRVETDLWSLGAADISSEPARAGSRLFFARRAR